MQVSLVYDLQASLVFLHVGLVQCSSYSVQIGYRTSVQTLEFRRLVYKWCEISSKYVFVFMKNGEVDSEWELRKSWSWRFVLEKQESESFLRADRTKQTRGWLSEEKTFSCWLMFPHFASAITSAAQGPLQRQSHRLATIMLDAIMHSFVALMLFLEWEQGAFTQPVSYFEGL